MGSTRRLGFACHWDRSAPQTWSHTPWQLRAALRAHAEVIDLGVQLPEVVRQGLRGIHARRRGDRWTSSWRQSRTTDAIVARVLRSAQHECDVVLQIGDLAVFDRPFFVYQDLSYDLLERLSDNPGIRDQFAALTAANVARRQRRQQDVYDRATGVLAMSRWFADSLVDDSGLPPDKVHVVQPGATAVPTSHELEMMWADPPDEPARRLLFVGRDFHRKGGPDVVTAVQRLRHSTHPDLRLSVVGPGEWPLEGPPPEGVTHHGSLDTAGVRSLFATHDVFVMPSRFEAFGIVFAEALSWGLPCVARHLQAMPEIVHEGRTGSLVPADGGPDEVADAIRRVCDDPTIRTTARAGAADARAHYSWDRAARDVLAAVDAGR